MITRDDYAKMLDFGLAKLIEPQRTLGPASGSSEIATRDACRAFNSGYGDGHGRLHVSRTGEGRVNEIDHRSDIFSFGCILFEAATGQRAFDGKDVLDSLHKIVHAPTPQLKDTNPLAPDGVAKDRAPMSGKGAREALPIDQGSWRLNSKICGRNKRPN